MGKRDYYEILGVDKDAMADDIKNAYRKLAVKYHPDKNPGDTQAAERLREVLAAYKVLGDPDKRARYDKAASAKPKGGDIVAASKAPAKSGQEKDVLAKKPASSKGQKRKAKKDPKLLKKKIKFILVNVAAMVAVIILVPYLTLLWLDSYTNHGETCTVPRVNGRVLSDAQDLLADNNLGYAILEYKYKEGAAQDEVLKQYPEPGAEVKEGRKVGLILNTIVKPKRSVPFVIDNRTYREAESHIRAAGFIIENVDTVAGEKDWVYELRYEDRALVNGEPIPEGSRITVVIGNGRKRVEEEAPEFDESFGI